MAEIFNAATGWGPGRHRAALSVTFDNFGEAAEIETGRWGGKKVGDHHTAAFLPRLIEMLEGIKATYFMEASNASIYPNHIRTWQDAGHEVALHGWRHEFWMQCPPERRTALLADSVSAMRAIGVELAGFRPPGGGMPPEAWGELEGAGLRYCSPAGPQGVRRVGKLVSLPFEWRAVDAYMIEPVLGFLRLQLGGHEAAHSVAEWASTLDRMLTQLVEKGEHRTIIFHPEFLGQAEDKRDVLRTFVEAARKADVWIAPTRDVAAFVASQMDLPITKAA